MNKPAAPHRGRLEWVAIAILLVTATWYWLQFYNRSTNLLDEGSTAAQAMRVVNGELIYRDFFTVVTPGSYYTVAWLFRTFGPSLMVLRWAAFATGIAIVLVTFVVTRRLAPWPFAAGAALMTTVWGWFLVTPNFYSLQAALFTLVALACYLRGWIVVAGIAAGAAAMTKQNTGAYVAAALLIAIWASAAFDARFDGRARLRRSARFIAGVCVVVVPTLAWLLARGAGPYLYESWVYYPLAKYPQRFALPYPEFRPALDALPALLRGQLSESARHDFWINCVLHLPAIVYPLALLPLTRYAWHSRSGRWHSRSGRYAWHSHSGRYAWHSQPSVGANPSDDAHALLALSLVGLFSLFQSWPRADATHILFGLQPTFSLFAYLLSLCTPGTHNHVGTPGTHTGVRVPGVPRVVFTAIAVAPLLGLLWAGYARTKWEYQNYIAGLHVERGRGIFTQHLEAQRIDTVTQYIVDHTAPDEPIFVVPWASGFYFLADRSNPTRTDFMLFEDPELYPCLIARLEERPPKYAIYGYTWDVDNKRFRDYAALVDQYIRTHYAIEFTTDGYEIWRRLADTPPMPRYANACQPRSFRWRDLVR